MTKRRKHFWIGGVLLLLLGLFILLPSVRAEAATGENWSLNDDTGVLTITGNDFSIGSTTLENFKGDIRSVVIQNGVTGLRAYAFEDCVNLASVSIPDTITAIPGRCFENCSSLAAVTLPQSVTQIGNDAFSGCTSLRSVNLPSGLTNIYGGAFYGCESLSGSIVIPEGITYLESSCFAGCKSLTGVTLPTTLEYIGAYAFKGCENLTAVALPQNVEYVNYDAFRDCTGLETVTFNQGLQWLGSNAFSGCSSLREIVFPSSVRSINGGAFLDDTALQNIVILNPKANIGYQALGPDSAVIHGQRYSNAHNFANENNRTIHFIDEGTVTRNATASSFGEKQYKCSTCGAVYTEELLPLELVKSDVTSVESTGSGLKVTWTGSEGAEGYNLYRKTGNGDYVLLKKVGSTSYVDTAVKSGVTYTYVVEAYTRLQKTEKGKSLSSTYILKPVISGLSSTAGGVKVSWKKVEGAVRYAVYRNGRQVAYTDKTSYVDTGAKKNGTSYRYKVAAYQSYYGSVAAESSQETTYYLMQQKITSLKNKKGKKLQVKYGKNNRATSYEIQYSTNKNFKKAVKKLSVKSKKTTTKTISKLKKGKTYYVRVRSLKKAGGKTYYSAWSNKRKIKISK